MNLEQLGLLGVFLAGAIPWFEAVAVVPAGILFGLDPVSVVLAAVVGNAATIFLFAFSGARVRAWLMRRRAAKGKTGESPRFAKAQRGFDRWGIFGMALLGPLVIGTQFAAAVSVAAGVKPLRTSLIITLGMALWSVVLAFALDALSASELLNLRTIS